MPKKASPSKCSLKETHYVAAFTDSDLLRTCDHHHATATSAAACISEPAGYVVDVRGSKLRSLTEVEEAEFQVATCGKKSRLRRALKIDLIRGLLPEH